MIIKTVSATYGRKFNLGDFNSLHLEATLWADIEEGEDLHEAMTALWGMARENVKSQAIPVCKPGTKAAEYFLGLPVLKDEDVQDTESPDMQG